jgi:hypothetical protein
VRTTNDPFDDPPDVLIGLKNSYIPDPAGKSGTYSRPGLEPAFGGAALYAGAASFRAQCIYSHTELDGSTVSFLVHGGRLFRVDAALSTAVDVTPVGITIDAALGTRVSMNSVVGTLVVNDQVNRPWIASNLTATPITGTSIDYDGAGVAWNAREAFYYGGSVFFPLLEVNGVSRQSDVSWCEPGTPDTGYQQATFDDNWTLETSSAGTIYGGVGTNNGFYYFRQQSIGLATGTVGSDLASTATLDAVAYNVGTLATQCIKSFGSAIYFLDAAGRPWRLVPGNPPEPIWYQLRGLVAQQATASPEITAAVASATIEPTLNKYIAAIWTSDATVFGPPISMSVFDANTGSYEGEWDLPGGVGIECVGTLTDSSGRSRLVVMTPGGFVSSLIPLQSAATILTTEGTGIELTTEGTGVLLTTEGVGNVWSDNGAVPDIQVTTARIGYDDNTLMLVDKVIVTTLNDVPVRVSVVNSMMPATVEGIPDPSPSQDGTYRLVCGFDAIGRGPSITVKPLTADAQWSAQRISVFARPVTAGSEDP